MDQATWQRDYLQHVMDVAVVVYTCIYSIGMHKPCLGFFRSTGDTAHDRTQHKCNTGFEVLVTVHARFF